MSHARLINTIAEEFLACFNDEMAVAEHNLRKFHNQFKTIEQVRAMRRLLIQITYMQIVWLIFIVMLNKRKMSKLR